MPTFTRGFFAGVVTTLLVLIIGTVGFVRSGRYPIGADRPHLPLTRALIDSLRDHATETAASDVAVPRLDDPMQVAAGAAHYDAMCTGCHLAPGRAVSPLRAGLYPQPPDLPEDGIDNAGEAFWIIKHGIKLSAMPAWGRTHTDAEIWAMVAFLQKLPHMTPAQYAQWVAKGKPMTARHQHMSG
jgi:mono/diheme cytochrome c family protein